MWAENVRAAKMLGMCGPRRCVLGMYGLRMCGFAMCGFEKMRARKMQAENIPKVLAEGNSFPTPMVDYPGKGCSKNYLISITKALLPSLM